MIPRFLFLILALLCFALQGCGFVAEGFRDEIQRQIILNKMQNLVEGVETQATIDALLLQGGRRYESLKQQAAPPPPKPSADPVSYAPRLFHEQHERVQVASKRRNFQDERHYPD